MRYLVLNVNVREKSTQQHKIAAAREHRFFLVCELRSELLKALNGPRGKWPTTGCRVVRDDAQIGDHSFLSELRRAPKSQDLLDETSVGLLVDADWTMIKGFAYPADWKGKGLHLSCEPTSKGFCQVVITGNRENNSVESSVMEEAILKRLGQSAEDASDSVAVGRVAPDEEGVEPRSPEEIAEDILRENKPNYVIPSAIEATLFDEIVKAAEAHPDDPRGQALERFLQLAESFESAHSGSSQHDA